MPEETIDIPDFAGQTWLITGATRGVGLEKARAASRAGARVILAVRDTERGRQVAAHDTVPFTLWVAARHRDDFETAMWTTAVAGGDVDTTCAIVGGIVAAGPQAHLPRQWRVRCEPLPGWAAAPPLTF